ncbi:hypothetical protein, partial [Achromobacter spanius]|uniref:hypothetical protein n=1 Tax=Achromobacter spanius TaxID=217203 RepID=UPI003F68E6F7
MTVISSLAGATGAAPLSTPVTVIRAGQIVNPAVDPAQAAGSAKSSVVMLGQGVSTIAGSVYDETGTVPDALAVAMSKSVDARTRVSPFADVGAAVLNRLRTDGGSHSQSQSQSRGAPRR